MNELKKQYRNLLRQQATTNSLFFGTKVYEIERLRKILSGRQLELKFTY